LKLTDILYLLTLTGPLFSVSHLIGERRTRNLEEKILKSFSLVTNFSLGVLLTFALVLSMLLFLLARTFYPFMPEIFLFVFNDEMLVITAAVIAFFLFLVETILFQTYLGWRKLRKWTTICIVLLFVVPLSLFVVPDSVVTTNGRSITSLGYVLLAIALLPAVFLYIVAFHVDFHAINRLIHKALVLICGKWRNITNTKPPWPISYGEKEYDVAKSFWFLSAFPLIAPIYGIIIPLLIVLSYLILLPFFVSEKLRVKLVPEKPIFFDLMGYVVSAISIVYLSADRMGAFN
jgi:hypothetical protein